MKKLLALPLLISLTFNSLSADEDLNNLLFEYKESVKTSKKTLNETIGHLTTFEQEDIKKLQLKTFADFLKLLRGMTISYNTYGVQNVNMASLSSSVANTLRIYINDHEISSVHTLSPFLTWDTLPLDFINHIEVYNGDGSLSIGNEPGITIIKLYTKNPKYEGESSISTSASSKGEKSVSFLQSFDLGELSYLFFLNSQEKDSNEYINNEKLSKDYLKNYAYLLLQNEKSKLEFGFANIKKDNFFGLSINSIPQNGEILSTDYYLSLTNYFLKDKSLKTILSYDFNSRIYEEKNDNTLMVIPYFQKTANLVKYYKEDLELKKYDFLISKETRYKNHNFLTALSLKQKEYKLKDRVLIDTTNTTTKDEAFKDFTRERITSFMLGDKYKFSDKLYLIANAKYDIYQRESKDIKDSNENLYRTGFIYMPTNYLGFKAFYTKSYIIPSFYSIDFAKKDTLLKTEKNDYLSLESVYSKDNNKVSILVAEVQTKDAIALNTNFTQNEIGFINLNDTIKYHFFLLDYEIKINKNHKFNFNYYASNNDYATTNSKDGAILRYTGTYDKLDYFTTLIYKEGYNINNMEIKDGYDVDLGATYNISKNLSIDLKFDNILDKALKSLHNKSNNSYLLENEEQKVTLGLNLVF